VVEASRRDQSAVMTNRRIAMAMTISSTDMPSSANRPLAFDADNWDILIASMRHHAPTEET
jgi:hypothetical protein